MTGSDDQRFYSGLNAKLKSYRDAKQHLDRFLSTDFNVFKWIEPENKDLLPDQVRRFEIRRSAIIADLLRDKRSHGQQRKFLDAFLQVIGRPDLKDKQLRKVDCEVSTRYGRIDILVEFENFGIAIENKPWAKEGNDQIQRYYEFLEEEYGPNGFCLVYLTLEGDEPTSIKDLLKEELMAANKLICISYNRDMLKWLEECYRLCESDKFRWFLRDFMDYINGEQTMSNQNERDIILKHALESETNLDIALDCFIAYKDGHDDGLLRRVIVDYLLKELEKELQRDFPEPQWKICTDFLREPFKKFKRFSLAKHSWKYAVTLEPQLPDLCTVYIGVRKDDPNEQYIDELKGALDRELNIVGRTSDWWVWYDNLGDWGPSKSKEEFFQMYRGTKVNDLKNYFDRIIKVAVPIIDEHVKGSSS